MALTTIKTGGLADNSVTDAKVADNITAGTAATLATARNINGVSFNGSSAITITAAAGTLTGNTLASGVTASSLTSVGTLTGLTVATDNENVARFDGLQGNIDFRYGSDIEFDRAGQVYITANNGSGELNFRTGGQNIAMHIDSSQKVGIGSQNTTLIGYADAAANNLVVGSSTGDEGITIISGASAGDYGALYFGDANRGTNGRIMYEQNNEIMSFYTNNTEKMRIALDGKVGIGEVNPSAILETTGAIDDNWAGRFENTHSGGYGLMAKIASSASGDYALQIRSGSTHLFKVMGNGDATFAGDVTLLGASSYARDLTFAHGASNYYWRMGYTSTSNGNSLAFINRDGGSEQEVMRMDWNKRVGIGRTPTKILDITQTQNADSSIRLTNSDLGAASSSTLNLTNGTDGAYLTLHGTGFTTSGVARQSGTILNHYNGAGGLTLNTQASAPIYLATNNTTALTIDTSQNSTFAKSIIATGNDHSLFSHNNELNLMYTYAGGGRIHFNYRVGASYTDFTIYNGTSSGYPDIEAGSFTTTSDYRMKKTVSTFTESICDKIKLLRPVTFNWKTSTNMTEAQQIGFLAHELQEQLPLSVKGDKDAMSEKGGIDPQTIKGEALSSYMMKALQEIITRLEALENA